MKTLYTAHVTSTGGREGKVISDDNKISMQLSPPGGSGSGTNPEQLFAAGYSACFASAMAACAKKMNCDITGMTITADVMLNEDGGEYSLGVCLEAKLPNTNEDQGEQLLMQAHKMCPYSKATRGNIDVTLKLNGHSLTAKA